MPAKRQSLNNRYFSVENVKKISENIENDTKKSASSESDQFIKRKDYLIQRLLKNRSLPGIENTEKEDSIDQDKPDIIEIKDTVSVRKHAFQEEFIPLFKTDSKEIKESETGNFDQESPTYYGPYPYDCMQKVTETVIEAFKPIKGATYTNRTVEIAKMKVRLPSKFDKDTRLWRRIQRESYQIRQQLKDKIESTKRHEYFINSKKKNKKIYFVELDENSDSNSEENVKENKKNAGKFDESEEENLSDGTIELESSSDWEMDSKCTQFGKYSKKNINEKQNKKAVKNKSNSKKNRKENEKSINNNSRLTKEESDDDELEMLRKQYRNLRNARNKAMNSIKKNVKDKSSKQMSLEIERKIMNEKITKVRRMIKKLAKKTQKREKSNFKQLAQTKQAKNVNREKKKLKITKQKKNKKNQNQKIMLL